MKPDKRLYPPGTIKDEPDRQFDGPLEGRIRQVTPKGIMFALPGFPRHLFGPAPYTKTHVEPGDDGDGPHDHQPTPPPVGAKCLVLFVGIGAERPWVLGWWDES